MARTLVQSYATSLVKGFVERARALKQLGHKPTKGQLRELFVSDVLKSFLTSQFGIGSGAIINQDGEQSRQMDIVIYDNRILPPFIREENIGVYPAPSVIATIEIKTTLHKKDLLAAENAAKILSEKVFAPAVPFGFEPLCAVFAFEGGFDELSQEEKGKDWLSQNAAHLFNICIAEKYCWARVGNKGWSIQRHEPKTYGEATRFIALILDNVRTHAQERFKYLAAEGHHDWFSIYIR
jgi:hypothetical protein